MADGKWITVNGTHIFVKNGQSTGEAFKNTTGKEISSKQARDISGQFLKLKSTPENDYASNIAGSVAYKMGEKGMSFNEAYSQTKKAMEKDTFPSKNTRENAFKNYENAVNKVTTKKVEKKSTAKQIVRDYAKIKDPYERGAGKKIKAMENIGKVVSKSTPKQKKEYSTYVTSKAKLKQLVHKARFNGNTNIRTDSEYKRLKSIVDKYEGKK